MGEADGSWMPLPTMGKKTGQEFGGERKKNVYRFNMLNLRCLWPEHVELV